MTNSSAAAPSAAIDLLCAGAMHGFADAVLPGFERIHGRRVAARFVSSGAVRQRILDGEAADVAISTETRILDLARQGKLLPDSARPLARSAIGVAIRAGATAPDLSSLDAFKRALLDAESIAYADPATGSPSGNYLVALFEQWGIAADLAPKLKLVGATPGQAVVVADAVAAGVAELGLQQICEILGVPGIALAGPLPEGAQHITIFSAAIPAAACDPAGGKLLIDYLRATEQAEALRGQGLEVG